METPEIVVTPIELLITFYTKELYNEIVYNGDSTGFWLKGQTYIFSNSLTSFREGLKALVDGMKEDKEMFNYFSTLCFRIFSQPYTSPALDVFSEGFDEIVDDQMLRHGFQWKTKDLSRVEVLILFLTVHRDEITIAMNRRIEFEKANLVPEKLSKKGRS